MPGFFHIVFLKEANSSGEPLSMRTITDVSICLETAKLRALALLPEMRKKGAITFVIRNSDGTDIYRWRPEAKIAKTRHETGGRARAYPLLRQGKRKV